MPSHNEVNGLPDRIRQTVRNSTSYDVPGLFADEAEEEAAAEGHDPPSPKESEVAPERIEWVEHVSESEERCGNEHAEAEFNAPKT